ncbi:hypothetical protein [Diaminobutyricimonas sp. TR449]|uniref:hypothetical protein n=1 Tax=Diaminobutyricimonas sp. TR449 TaxID=2708076 RepID=UPI001423F963|nr:hypothetical protein [Diaminobutyricimonas sp. TR449]
MTFEERRAWIEGIVAVVTYIGYVTVVLSQAGGQPLTEAQYIAPMFWAIGISIVLSIIVGIAASIGRSSKVDQRDREIYRLGQFMGQGWIVLAGVGALLLAMVEADYFWIANVIYLGFTLWAITSCIARVVAYRGGFQKW